MEISGRANHALAAFLVAGDRMLLLLLVKEGTRVALLSAC